MITPQQQLGERPVLTPACGSCAAVLLCPTCMQSAAAKDFPPLTATATAGAHLEVGLHGSIPRTRLQLLYNQDAQQDIQLQL